MNRYRKLSNRKPEWPRNSLNEKPAREGRHETGKNTHKIRVCKRSFTQCKRRRESHTAPAIQENCANNLSTFCETGRSLKDGRHPGPFDWLSNCYQTQARAFFKAASSLFRSGRQKQPGREQCLVSGQLPFIL